MKQIQRKCRTTERILINYIHVFLFSDSFIHIQSELITTKIILVTRPRRPLHLWKCCLHQPKANRMQRMRIIPVPIPKCTVLVFGFYFVCFLSSVTRWPVPRIGLSDCVTLTHTHTHSCVRLFRGCIIICEGCGSMMRCIVVTNNTKNNTKRKHWST